MKSLVVFTAFMALPLLAQAEDFSTENCQAEAFPRQVGEVLVAKEQLLQKFAEIGEPITERVISQMSSQMSGSVNFNGSIKGGFISILGFGGGLVSGEQQGSGSVNASAQGQTVEHLLNGGSLYSVMVAGEELENMEERIRDFKRDHRSAAPRNGLMEFIQQLKSNKARVGTLLTDMESLRQKVHQLDICSLFVPENTRGLDRFMKLYDWATNSALSVTAVNPPPGRYEVDERKRSTYSTYNYYYLRFYDAGGQYSRVLSTDDSETKGRASYSNSRLEYQLSTKMHLLYE